MTRNRLTREPVTAHAPETMVPVVLTTAQDFEPHRAAQPVVAGQRPCDGDMIEVSSR